MCVVAAYMLPRMYESSIRILVQRTGVQNPLATLQNAMTDEADDPLRILDEIIYSQKTIGELIDTLGLGTNIRSEGESRALRVKIRSNIQTKVQPQESFTITYYSDRPDQAQRGATILANIFIRTVSRSRNEQNALTVDFYQQKLNEFQQKLDASQQKMIATLRGRTQSSPGANMFMYTRLDQLDQQILDLDGRVKDNEQNLVNVQSLPKQVPTKAGRQALFELQRNQVPYALDLRTALASYEDILAKYTPKHPEAIELENQIDELLDRIGVALTSEIAKQKSQLAELHATRAKIVEQILNSSIEQEEGRDKESDYSVYQRLYNEMKVKLEEAQISLSLGRSDDSRYTIIDPALLPLYPSKPSRTMIIGGGGVLGFLLGVVSVIIAEMLDTTIRTPGEVIVFRKPILGLLPDARKGYRADYR